MSLTEEIVVRFLISHRSHLLAFIRGIVRDRDLAEDVYQEVCVTVVLKRDEIEDVGHLRNWCRQAARFRAIDALRNRNAAAYVMDQAVLDLGPLGEQVVEAEEVAVEAVFAAECAVASVVIVDRVVEERR